jgi:conjugative relaxase-like TrwC/TraI family protein
MLRIIHSVSPKHAKSYYSEGVAREGYYAEGQEMAGLWGGKAALKLGLSGRVDQKAFAMLCDNLNPATGEPLTARNMANRRVGYDFNFNLPKSVSIVYEYTQDKRILNCFRMSMRETMEELEQEAATRVRAGGRDSNRTTGKPCTLLASHHGTRPIFSFATRLFRR